MFPVVHGILLSLPESSWRFTRTNAVRGSGSAAITEVYFRAIFAVGIPISIESSQAAWLKMIGNHFTGKGAKLVGGGVVVN